MTNTSTIDGNAATPRASFIAGSVIVSTVVLLAILSFFWTPHDPTAFDVAARFSPPSFTHWMGANHLGRDVFSMIMVGARVSIAVALVAVGIGVGIGAPLGLVAASRGGIIDDAIMRGGDLIFAFPALIVAILITAIFGPGAINAIIAIGIFNIPVFARLTRGSALPLWNRNYVLAARTAGKNRAQISLEHILPNIMHLLVVQATVQFSLGILAEAGLSYVGLGAQPPTPSWGRMLAESQTMFSFAPWLVLFPGLVIFLFVFSMNLLGDGLRRRLDPRSEGVS
ncbi:MAG: ABC transporter permease [Pseudomonadota bacterium]